MIHTAAKMYPAIGQVVQVRVEAWTIPMKVIDAKSAYGNIRVEVEPMNGQGRAWIELSRVVIPSDSTHLVNCHA
jgi:hypothetical protein